MRTLCHEYTRKDRIVWWSQTIIALILYLIALPFMILLYSVMHLKSSRNAPNLNDTNEKGDRYEQS